MKKIIKISVYTGIAFAIFAISCKNKPAKERMSIAPAFYLWKNTTGALSENEITCIAKTKTEKLYVKFFEVEKDELLGAIPVAKTAFHYWGSKSIGGDSVQRYILNNLEIIPVVYINNNVLQGITEDSVALLAENILFLIDKYYQTQIKNSTTTYNELQIDCDWTATTKNNYFNLLRRLDEKTEKIISCTLRLYPFKYRKNMGVPPVNKVMLMCYNLNNPLQYEDKNSILDVTELSKYVKNAKPYPLPIDVALPVFSWAVLYHNNQFSGLLNIEGKTLSSITRNVKPLWYAVTKDTLINDVYLRKGDELKLEEVSTDDLKHAIVILKNNINFSKHTTVTLFSIDDKNNNHDTELFKTVFNNFNH
ncbi:MAG: hypothetical protein ACK5NK_06815 [Niabella sp.]